MCKLKKCGRCKLEKEISEFSKCKSRGDGYNYCCKFCASKIHKKFREENREKVKEKKHQYYKDNKEKILGSQLDYINKRRREEPLFRLSSNIRTLVRNSFKRGKNQHNKGAKTEEILGCTILEFINHLQSLFTEGMSLENNGTCEECWHIDHKIPISSAKTEDEIIKLNHYTNLQPLWSDNNLSKGNKII